VIARVPPSALKLAYASWSKSVSGTCSSRRGPVASAQGVEPWLLAEWDRAGGDLRAISERAAAAAATKGWVGRRDARVAALVADSGLPDGFHLAAAEVFARIPGQAPTPTPEG